MRALTEYFTLFEIILIISACVLVFLRQHRGFSGGVEGAQSGARGERPERSSVPRDHQSGCTSAALIHVSTACFCTFQHGAIFAQTPNLISSLYYLSVFNPFFLLSQSSCMGQILLIIFTATLLLTYSTLLFFFSHCLCGSSVMYTVHVRGVWCPVAFFSTVCATHVIYWV